MSTPVTRAVIAANALVAPNNVVPTPPGSLLFGNGLDFARDPFGQPSRWRRSHGDLVKLRVPVIGPIYLVSHPDDVERVLVSDFRSYRKHVNNRALSILLGNGLVTSEGDDWRRNRRLVNPGFDRGHLRGYADVIVDCTLRALQVWRDGTVRDLHADLNALTLDIAARCLFGADLGVAELDTIGESLETLGRWYMGVGGSGVRLPTWVPTPTNVAARRAVKRVDDIVHRIIGARRGQAGLGTDLLSMLLAAQDEDGQGLSDAQLRDEVVTLLVAGHETSGSVLTMAMHLLAQHPEVEAQLQHEVGRVLGGRAPTLDDLSRLSYTRDVLLEIMRLYPPIWGLAREAIESVELGGHQLPAGSQIFVMLWANHRDERFFDDPERFDPGRWGGGALARRLPRNAYVPFGSGARSCIGKRFAMMENALVLATIAQRFAPRSLQEGALDLVPTVTLRPRGGLPMRLRRRRAQTTDGSALEGPTGPARTLCGAPSMLVRSA